MKKLVALLLFTLAAGHAWAGSSTVLYNSTGGAPFATTTDGSSNNVGRQTIWDYSAAANGASVDAGHGLLTAGEGVAGTPAGGVLTVQGVASMTALQSAQSGTWTVQPGNTANTTAWLVTGTGGVFPASQSGTWTVQPGNTANTTPWLFQIRDAAGNARGANVNVSNQLSVSCDNGCSATSSITGWGGGTLGAMANYGTSPGAVLVPGVNAFITNTNANGRATAANSSPVVAVAAASTAGSVVPNNTTAVVVKASAGTLFGVQIYGISSAPAYLKIYNATSATCGAGTPVKRLMIPAASTAANGAGSNVTFGTGLAFGTGITYCVTTGIADADATAPAASTFLVNLDYE